MPIDASIISRLQPAQQFHQPDPLEQYGKSLTLQNLMMQQQQAQRGMADEDAVRSAYQQAGGDSKALRALLQSGGQYKQVQALDKIDLENQAKQAAIGKDTAAAGKSNYEVQLGKLQHGAALLAEAKDPQSFAAILRVGQMTGTFAPEFVAQVSQQGYSPQLVTSLQNAGMTRAQQLDDQRKREQQAETGRHNLAGEQNAAGQLAVSRGNLGIAGANLGLARERLGLEKTKADEGKWVNDLERGIQINQATGVTRPITDAGMPIAPRTKEEKPLTESQGKASGLATRAQKAHDILNTLEDQGALTPGLVKQAAGGVPIIGGALEAGVNTLPRWAGGPNAKQQQVEQAQRDFVNAALRVESGAAISDSEFQNARKQYFPQPGDSTQVIEQKRRNRETEIESLKLQGGPGSKGIKSTYSPPRTVAGKIDPAKLSDAELKRELGLGG